MVIVIRVAPGSFGSDLRLVLQSLTEVQTTEFLPLFSLAEPNARNRRVFRFVKPKALRRCLRSSLRNFSAQTATETSCSASKCSPAMRLYRS